jgi:amino acid adenylation domain-containing protein
LDSRASLLAGQLRASGVGPEILVGLCASRSAALLVGALGILKSGGAYLPIDPSEPEARSEAMLADAGVSVLVMERSLNEKAATSNRQIVRLDHKGGLLKPRSRSHRRKEAPPHVSSNEDGSEQLESLGPKTLAYVIYTSGSTGTPKGVEITHESLSNLVLWHRNAFRITPEDRATCIARVGFDASVWEIWPYLAAGASLHVPDDDKLNDPEALQAWLISQAITITFVPTPMAERLLALHWPDNAPLRIMLTGGDALHVYPTPDLPFTLVNNYGPTECAVVATSGMVPTARMGNRLPSIGRPIANTKVLLLNGDLAEVPPGTLGEIYIGGVGVARGYRNHPDLTAERFIPDPFEREAGRLFRTGDRAQYLPDGQIVFLGRLDEQIKIRGFRIEPSEIISILDEHPLVSQSVVIARGATSPDDLRLVAYIVPKGDSLPTFAELREFLAGRLPDYMLPAIFAKLDRMPLTPNGKVDRSALPAPDALNTIGDGVIHRPQTEIEEIVAGTLAPLLGVQEVDVKANFFSMGAHSLLGIQLISRLRESLGVDLCLRTLFDAPSVVELSAAIERALCAKLEAMSEDEVQRTLNDESQACQFSSSGKHDRASSPHPVPVPQREGERPADCETTRCSQDHQAAQMLHSLPEGEGK